MIHRISCDQIEEGMFIAGFGGSWFNHPFWRAKFVVSSPTDLDRVRRSAAPFVLIDDSLGKGIDDGRPARRKAGQGSDQSSALDTPKKGRKKAFYRPIAAQDRAYDKDAEERRKTAAMVSHSKDTMRAVFEDARMGCAVHYSSVNAVVNDVTEAVARNAHILLNVVRLKTKDDYTYLHSVAVCAMMVCVGQYRKMDEQDVRELGMAGLLHDVGKIAIPDPILNKEGPLTDGEYAEVRDHPEHGFQLLSGTGGIGEMALDVCRHHHEKMDGSGYPFGLPAENISFAARLGAICDVYDALTSDRAYKKAWSPRQAMADMWSWKGHFDRSILSDMMLAINVVPGGMLVKLSDDRLALTLEPEPYDTRQTGIAFYCSKRGKTLANEKFLLGSSDATSIVSVEDPKVWAFDDWDEMRTRIRIS